MIKYKNFKMVIQIDNEIEKNLFSSLSHVNKQESLRYPKY